MRVVDASVIPLITGVAIQSTVYAIAEKVGLHLDWLTLARSDLAASSGRRYTQKRVGSRVGRIRSPCRSDINPVPLAWAMKRNYCIFVVVMPVRIKDIIYEAH